MDLLSVIRRWHGRDKLSIREISRRTGLSRHTIRKYLASGTVEPKYPPRSSASKLDPFAATLSAWLKREARRKGFDAGGPAGLALAFTSQLRPEN